MNFTGERFVPELEGWIALQHYHRYYFVLNQLDLTDKVVLDIACGEGFGSYLLAKSSKFVIGVDISEETILHANKKYSTSNINFLVGNAASIPLESNSTDIIVSFETLEHHNKHDEMMQEIKRVLKENGVLIISSPDKGYYDKYLPSLTNEYHVKELFNQEFKELMCRYFQFAHFFIQNNVIGSFIANEEENITYKRPLNIEKKSGKSEKIEPRFNICISSNYEMQFSSSISICSPTLFYDIFSTGSVQDITIQKQKILLDNIYRSYTWKIGKLITFLIKKIMKLFK